MNGSSSAGNRWIGTEAFEMWNSILRPKRWAIPERLEAVKQEKAEIQAIMDEGLGYGEAWN